MSAYFSAKAVLGAPVADDEIAARDLGAIDVGQIEILGCYVSGDTSAWVVIRSEEVERDGGRNQGVYLPPPTDAETREIEVLAATLGLRIGRPGWYLVPLLS